MARIGWSATVLALGLAALTLGSTAVGVVDATLAHDGEDRAEIKLDGFVDVPNSALTLPLAPGSQPVTVILSFGIPLVQLPISITSTTKVKAEGSLPVTLADGDRVRVEVDVALGVLRARRLEIEDFPELRLRGTAADLPAPGLSLPLASGAPPVDFTLQLGVSGLTVPIRLTPGTHAKGGAFMLHNGDFVEVKAVARDAHIVATKIEVE